MVNINPVQNKAEHTVAMRRMLPEIEQLLRDRKYGPAQEKLWEMIGQALELRTWINRQVVDFR